MILSWCSARRSITCCISEIWFMWKNDLELNETRNEWINEPVRTCEIKRLERKTNEKWAELSMPSNSAMINKKNIRKLVDVLTSLLIRGHICEKCRRRELIDLIFVPLIVLRAAFPIELNYLFLCINWKKAKVREAK